ncbi:hypothetical protein GCM10007042_32580 [Butyricimonas paravirosa]|nr:hypothetical protein GCM10007042_32580 [Butyricimonas paravirosa]
MKINNEKVYKVHKVHKVHKVYGPLRGFVHDSRAVDKFCPKISREFNLINFTNLTNFINLKPKIYKSYEQINLPRQFSNQLSKAGCSL